MNIVLGATGHVGSVAATLDGEAERTPHPERGPTSLADYIARLVAGEERRAIG